MIEPLLNKERKVGNTLKEWVSAEYTVGLPDWTTWRVVGRFENGLYKRTEEK